MNLAQKLKAYYDDPANQQEIQDRCRRLIEDHEQRERALVTMNFPEHADHNWEEFDSEYFDAMFVSMTYKCSCGENFKITREMVDGYNRA